MLVRYGAALYREAGAADLARQVASYLFGWLAKAKVSKQAVLAWLKTLYETVSGEGRHRAHDSASSLVPSYLIRHIAKVFSELSEKGATFGDFVAELSSALDNPPEGYEWVVRDGQEYLVRSTPRTRPTMPVRGKRFRGYVLVGVWWVTPLAKSSSNRQLRSFLQRHNGGVFYQRAKSRKVVEDAPIMNMAEYGGFLVAPQVSVEGLGIQLRDLGSAVIEDGGRFHLSAVKLDKLAELDPESGRAQQLNSTDQFFTHSVKSSVFRPEEPRHTLFSVVNGQVQEYRGLLEQLRRAVQ